MKPPEELHAAIMNIRCQTPASENAYGAYERGHRDARHAAAELAQEFIAAAIRERDAEYETRLAEFRDAVLNGRHQLECLLDNDQTNAVLGLFDDVFEDVFAAHQTTEGHTDRPPTPEDVEAVAKAIYDAEMRANGHDPAWGLEPDGFRVDRCRLARAAIAAWRERVKQ